MNSLFHFIKQNIFIIVINVPKLEDDVMKKLLQLYCGPWLSNLSGQIFTST